MSKITIKDLVKNNNVACFDSYRCGFIYYNVVYYDKAQNSILNEAKAVYRFPIDLSDIGNATLNGQEKAITLMRYIRKAKEDKTLVRVDNFDKKEKTNE